MLYIIGKLCPVLRKPPPWFKGCGFGSCLGFFCRAAHQAVVDALEFCPDDKQADFCQKASCKRHANIHAFYHCAQNSHQYFLIARPWPGFTVHPFPRCSENFFSLPRLRQPHGSHNQLDALFSGHRISSFLLLLKIRLPLLHQN